MCNTPLPGTFDIVSLWESLILLLAAGFVGGAMNAAGGGGSFVTLPAMITAGVHPVVANASSSVALFPGSVASATAARRDLAPIAGASLRMLVAITAGGGLIGAALLVNTPSAVFGAVVPWLLLFATVTFAVGRSVGKALRSRLTLPAHTVLVRQFVLGVYGGYIGGAVGILMMATWSLLSTADLHELNPAKNLMVGAARAIAVLFFVATSSISWAATIPVLLAGVAGGWVGARGARRVSSSVLRTGIITVMAAITTAFFLNR